MERRGDLFEGLPPPKAFGVAMTECMDLKQIKSAHLIGVGGINMSAVAKILLAAGIKVSGSDLVANDQTKILTERGADIKISEDSANIPEGCELVIVTSAAPVTNKERIAAAQRKIPEMTNFAFLSQWFADYKTIVIAGTHGKSTTTAMLGLMMEKAGLDPTVVVGSKVPGFSDGNLRLGKSDLFVIEGDEYAHHFLEFHPYGLILNNLELDHTDVFGDIESLLVSFHEMVGKVKEGGIIVANTSDSKITSILETEMPTLLARNVRVVRLGEGEDAWKLESKQVDLKREVTLSKDQITYRFNLAIPGHFNAMNAAAAALMTQGLGGKYEAIAASIQEFKGIWRRFEFLGEKNGALVYSDYGHHPTAVEATLKAARESFQDKRLVLCFQPHHRSRTKALFQDFVKSFDLADVLILCEIYDVAGRDEDKDKEVSSKQLVDAVAERNRIRGVENTVEFASDPAVSVARTFELVKENDVVIFMGAGDIDGAVRNAISTGTKRSEA